MICPFCVDFRKNGFTHRLCQVFLAYDKFGGPWHCSRPVHHAGPHIACIHGVHKQPHIRYVSPNTIILKFNKGKELESQS